MVNCDIVRYTPVGMTVDIHDVLTLDYASFGWITLSFTTAGLCTGDPPVAIEKYEIFYWWCDVECAAAPKAVLTLHYIRSANAWKLVNFESGYMRRQLFPLPWTYSVLLTCWEDDDTGFTMLEYIDDLWFKRNSQHLPPLRGPLLCPEGLVAEGTVCVCPDGSTPNTSEPCCGPECPPGSVWDPEREACVTPIDEFDANLTKIYMVRGEQIGLRDSVTPLYTGTYFVRVRSVGGVPEVRYSYAPNGPWNWKWDADSYVGDVQWVIDPPPGSVQKRGTQGIYLRNTVSNLVEILPRPGFGGRGVLYSYAKTSAGVLVEDCATTTSIFEVTSTGTILGTLFTGDPFISEPPVDPPFESCYDVSVCLGLGMDVVQTSAFKISLKAFTTCSTECQKVPTEVAAMAIFLTAFRVNSVGLGPVKMSAKLGSPCTGC